MKTTAGNAAIELRRLAAALDAQPDAEIEQPYVSFYCEAKAPFLALVHLLPRPLKKSERDTNVARWARIMLSYENTGIRVNASVPKSLTYELVEPAKPAVYRCDPILSIDDEKTIA